MLPVTAGDSSRRRLRGIRAAAGVDGGFVLPATAGVFAPPPAEGVGARAMAESHTPQQHVLVVHVPPIECRCRLLDCF